MENTIENLQDKQIINNDLESSKICKKIKFMFLYIILWFFWINFVYILLNFLPLSDQIIKILYIFIITILYLIIFIWIIFIPIYSIYQKKKGKIESKCLKWILIIWSLPIIIPLIAFWWCLILFWLFSWL